MEAKVDRFNKRQQKIALAAKLLSHPARISIMEYLSDQDACMTGNITEQLPLSRGTANQHIKALKNAGWIKGTICGSRICYCLNNKKVKSDINQLFKFLEKCRTKTENAC